MSGFFQDGPELGNQYQDDRPLRSILGRLLPAEMLAEIEPGLVRLGHRAVTDIAELAREAHAQEPVHVPYDPWGRRIDDIRVSSSWKALDVVAAEEGIVATGYERTHGALSRIHQFAKLYLFAASSAIYACPLAMTDGAASTLRGVTLPEAVAARSHLMSRDPTFAWTSGQ